MRHAANVTELILFALIYTFRVPPQHDHPDDGPSRSVLQSFSFVVLVSSFVPNGAQTSAAKRRTKVPGAWALREDIMKAVEHHAFSGLDLQVKKVAKRTIHVNILESSGLALLLDGESLWDLVKSAESRTLARATATTWETAQPKRRKGVSSSWDTASSHHLEVSMFTARRHAGAPERAQVKRWHAIDAHPFVTAVSS